MDCEWINQIWHSSLKCLLGDKETTRVSGIMVSLKNSRLGDTGWTQKPPDGSSLEHKGLSGQVVSSHSTLW